MHSIPPNQRPRPRLRQSVFILAVLTIAHPATQPAGADEDKRRELWITNAYGNDVHVYDMATFDLLANFKVGPNPHGISATADGRTVHIALEDFSAKAGKLVWIDAVKREITGELAIGPKPNECECTPDGRWIYVPCDDGQWWVIDGHSRQVVKHIKTGGRPHNTVVSPDGKRMYLSPMGSPKRVTIVDVEAGHEVIGEIPFDNITRPPAISGDERLFFQQIDGLVGFQVADIEQRKVVKTIQHALSDDEAATPSRCHGLGMRPDQREIWSCDVEHHAVFVHEATSGDYRQIARVPMIGRVYWLSFTPDSKYTLISVRSESKIAVVDCATKQVVRHLEAGREPKRTQVIDVPRR